MTNREWLNSLSDEELADVIFSIANNRCCMFAYCDTVEDEDGYSECDWNCKEGIRKYLRAEHKDD